MTARKVPGSPGDHDDETGEPCEALSEDDACETFPENDLGAAFTAAMQQRPRTAIPNVEPVDLSGFSLVCQCGMDWAHAGRCARCAARNDRLICGLANNHQGQHQAIALWS